MTLSRVRMKCSDFRKGEFIMKKIITLILVGCMALSIGGCSAKDTADSLDDTINEAVFWILDWFFFVSFTI